MKWAFHRTGLKGSLLILNLMLFVKLITMLTILKIEKR